MTSVICSLVIVYLNSVTPGLMEFTLFYLLYLGMPLTSFKPLPDRNKMPITPSRCGL